MAKSEGGPHGGAGSGKSPAELIKRFGNVTAALEGIERRQMFGYPAAFANGYMFTGLHQANWVVRLPDDALTELRSAGGRPFEPMVGRPMSGYLAFPQELVDKGAPALMPWLERSLDYVRSLPVKESGRKSR
jgi:TfoX/Sxy family transcriptional regulator of competence genes